MYCCRAAFARVEAFGFEPRDRLTRQECSDMDKLEIGSDCLGAAR